MKQTQAVLVGVNEAEDLRNSGRVFQTLGIVWRLKLDLPRNSRLGWLHVSGFTKQRARGRELTRANSFDRCCTFLGYDDETQRWLD